MISSAGVHGGLECGVLAAAYPDIAMLSLGADIRDAHTPRERVSVSSVGRLTHLVNRIVETLT